MKSLLIKDTTKEERMAIIEESVGDDAGGCDGCSAGILKCTNLTSKEKWSFVNAIWHFVRNIFQEKIIR